MAASQRSVNTPRMLSELETRNSAASRALFIKAHERERVDVVGLLTRTITPLAS